MKLRSPAPATRRRAAVARAMHRRYLSRTHYSLGERRFHYRDLLVMEEDPPRLGLEPGSREILPRVRSVLGEKVSPARILVLRRAPKVLVFVLEHEPGVHPPDDLTLEELLDANEGAVRFLPRRRALPVTPKREGERVLPARVGTKPAGREGKARRIVFHFSRIPVGLGDRLVGLASVMVLGRALGAAVTLDRPFLPQVFENGPTDDSGDGTYDLDFLDTRYRYHELLRTSDFSHLGPVAHVIGNECAHHGLYLNPHLRGRLGEFGDDLRRAYRDIFTLLLRPRREVLDEVDRILAQKGGRELVGIQLRTGHLEREFPHYSRGDVVRYCRRIREALPGRGERYLVFVTADDNPMAALARETLGAVGLESVTVEAPVLHVSYGTHQGSQAAQLKLIADLLTLARSDHLFFSLHSNYGRVAHMLGEHATAWGLYGRNFDLLSLADVYAASSKHLVYSDAAASALGGLLKLRYYDEYDSLGLAALIGRALPGFGAGMARGALRRGWVPFREVLRIFMESLHRAEGAREDLETGLRK